MPGKPSKADWAQKNEEKIMPTKRIDLDPSDIVEIRNLSKWVARELKIFKNDAKTQDAIENNYAKVTTLPIEELLEAMNSGY